MASELFEMSVMEVSESNESMVQSDTPHAKKAHIERFKFTGKGGEYFGIWIVNILLTIITLGIYSAWAKVRNKQYFYGNTYLDNSSFEYTATPLQILRGRIVAVILFAVYLYAESYVPGLALILLILLFLGSPWIIMKSLAFNAHYSEYRGIKFIFHQNLLDSVKTFLLMPILAFLPAVVLFAGFGFMFEGEGTGNDVSQINHLAILPLLALVTMYLAYPFIVYISHRYTVGNHAYGNEDFRFRINSPKPYFSIYLKALGLFILIVVVFAVIMFASSALLVGIGDIMSGNVGALGAGSIFIIIGIYLLGAFLYALLFAYVKAKTYNLVYQRTALAKHKLRAKIKTFDLAMLYLTNTLGIIVTLGLFIPWAKVRTARFLADNTAVQVYGDLSSFVGVQADYQNALGEEMGEVFDLDIGL